MIDGRVIDVLMMRAQGAIGLHGCVRVCCREYLGVDGPAAAGEADTDATKAGLRKRNTTTAAASSDIAEVD